MKNFNKLLILSGVLLLASTLFGQTILTQTTLASAVATQSTTAIRLTSATGVVATSTVLFVLEGQGEAMFVNSVVGTTAYVTRGYEGYGSASPHSSGAVVFVIPGVAMAGPTGALNAVPPDGSCTRSSIAYLPVISTGVTGSPVFISDCVGGVWVNGIASPPKLMNYQLQLPNIGSVAYSAAGTSTAKATNTMYCTEIDLPYNKNLTGLGMLNGAATGTDKWVLALYDSAGTLLANSATAGVVASGNSTFQKQAFTVPYYAVGPAQYFACAQGDSGTTATINLIPTGTQDSYLTKKFASQTFGTLASIAVPTTFTTLSGGYWILY